MDVMYESLPERELIKMWQDIEGGNVAGVNRSLMKVIANNEEESGWKVGGEDPLYMMRMFDTEKWQWVPFNMLDAYSIVNERKENLVVQIWRPTNIQPEYGPTLKGWHTMDTSYLNDALRDKKSSYSESSNEAFQKMINQDRQELIYEARYDEIQGHYRNSNRRVG